MKKKITFTNVAWHATLANTNVAWHATLANANVAWHATLGYGMGYFFFPSISYIIPLRLYLLVYYIRLIISLDFQSFSLAELSRVDHGRV
jgi:hypothetical protein